MNATSAWLLTANSNLNAPNLTAIIEQQTAS